MLCFSTIKDSQGARVSLNLTFYCVKDEDNELKYNFIVARNTSQDLP